MDIFEEFITGTPVILIAIVSGLILAGAVGGVAWITSKVSRAISPDKE
jgi:hypothetical protein